MTETSYIVRSGPGYVCDKKTLKMFCNPKDDVDSALHGERMTLEEASKTASRMIITGLEVEIINLIINRRLI